MSVTSDKITVQFDGKRCIHARRCVLGLPKVFRPGTKGGWIFPDEASADDLVKVVESCPSGALTYERVDDGAPEETPQVNTLRLWADGPVELRADIHVDGENPRNRALLCRCGQSMRKPYCDNSHRRAGFEAKGELPSDETAPNLDVRDGVVDVKPVKDGPVMVTGNVEIIGASGARITTVTKTALCRCGASENKPFCDGSHKKINFKSDEQDA